MVLLPPLTWNSPVWCFHAAYLAPLLIMELIKR